MRLSTKLVALSLVLVCTLASRSIAEQIRGSGSTFVYPVMSVWTEAYRKLTGTDIGYEPIGSSGGITEIRASVVDFGASDAPLQPQELAADGLAQFPVVIGGIVPVVNLDGFAPGQLKFTGPLLADIYLGKVIKWNDPAIAAVNPGVTLPDRRITVIFRTDGSGTTFNWVDYLSKVSTEWKTKVGVGTKVSWPTGVGGNGNGGVADGVAKIKGAIGYVEYAYVLKRKMTYGLVQNKASNFVGPSSASFQAAAENADWANAKDFYLLMTDAPGPESYPITATSFVLMRRQPKNKSHNADLIAFFKWALQHGQDEARDLGYVPLPASLVEKVQTYWQAQVQ